jgi:Zn2+/Cd2+-exporting ATPase
MQKKVLILEKNEHVYRLQGLSCANCAAKFEKNVRDIASVQDVKINFGASKIKVVGEATIDQLESAGAFDGIKVVPEKKRLEEHKKQSFWKKQSNITTMFHCSLPF